MRILITGAAGFLGANLQVRLRELGHEGLDLITRDSTPQELRDTASAADFVFHLAGANRPPEEVEFARTNAGFTASLAEALEASGRAVPIVFASSTQAELGNAYGRSKLAAEQCLRGYAQRSGAPLHLFRLTNVFGKWARPHYNSAVATFCHQVARGLLLSINDPAAQLRLVYVDDVVAAFIAALTGTSAAPDGSGFAQAGPVYETSVGEVARQLQGFAGSRDSLTTERVGQGLRRALYATYLSHLRPEQFAYDVPRHGDARGVFVEMLKTPDCGQFSYFTAHPGITRGEHYHHSKTEKFLVIKGRARFGFRHIVSDETHWLEVAGGEGRIVETVPGWTHDITNVGDDELIVMLWANEIFDRSRPDTVALKVAAGPAA